MRTRWRLTLGLVIALLVVLAIFLRSYVWSNRTRSGAVTSSDDCDQERKMRSNRGCLALGVVTSSVWDDGTVALAIPVENPSAVPVRQTEISAITISSGKLVKPASLPQHLSDISQERRAIVDAHFSGLANPGAYELIISGSYLGDGSSHQFSLRQRISIVKSRDGTATSVNTTVSKHVTPGKPLAPTKIQPEHENPEGPPIPDGVSISPLVVPPKATSVALASSSNEVTIIRDANADHNSMPAPPDPSTAVGGGLVLSTGNAYLRLSLDDGVNFTEIDPTTIFPTADGGLCCDQVMLFDRTTNLFFWLLQYNRLFNPTNPTKPGPNRLRLAWASPASIRANSNNWTFVDLQAQVLLKTSDEALDYPDLGVTNNNLYVSVDVVDKRDPMTGKPAVHGLIVARIPLAHITAGGSTVGVSWIGPDQSTDQLLATGGRLTQSSADAMYWAGHVDASKVKVFRWKDSNDKVDTHDVKVNKWCIAAADYASLAPDGIQWIDNSGHTQAVSSGARRPFSDPGQNHGEVWLPWNAGKDDGSGDCSKNRPQPYVKILRINDQSLEGIGEYHIWNPNYAFAFPALATSAAGEIGVSVPYGGPSDYPTSTVGFLNDLELFALEDSNVTLSLAGGATRIGDFYVVRNSGPSNINLSTQGYAVRLVNPAMSTSCTIPPGCVFHVHYIQWGRPPVTIP
jgi:hypothetical protein